MKTPRHIVRREAGFSLLEMMIAVVILGVITSQLFLALTAQRGSNRSDSVAVDTQETTRLVLDLISLDTRNAGMLVPREVSVASVDGGNGAGAGGSDRLCVSDGSIFQIPAPGVANAFWNNLGDTFNGSVGQANNNAVVQTINTLDIESTLTVGGDPTLAGGSMVDFAINAGAIVTTGKRDPNGNWTVAPTARRTFCGKIRFVDTTAKSLTLFQNVPFSGEVTVVPAIIYEIGANPNDATVLTLLRNNIPISDQIEDLQVQYWVDSSPTNGAIDGTTEWPLDSLDGRDTTRIRRVRLYTLGRTRVQENAGGTMLTRHHHPGMANRLPGTAYDNFQREVFVASVLPRNLYDYLENPNAQVPNVP